MHLKNKCFCIESVYSTAGSGAKNLVLLQNQCKPSQLGKLIIYIIKKMTHKGENYSDKLKKHYFCNGTHYHQKFIILIFKINESSMKHRMKKEKGI
jgi:hypothetical protein